jgi:hypothetical protein
VEFPVEILGKDGQVRRLSFGDSMRLYQRRIRSSSLRYETSREIHTEIQHCTQRIEQLRRSYLEHFAWGPFRGQTTGNVLGSSLLADVVFFLRRLFDDNPDTLAALHVQQIESGLCDICFVQSGSCVYLLHAWQIELPAAKAHFETTRKRLLEAPLSEGVERLLLQWESKEVTIILSGTTPPSGSAPVEDLPPPATGDAWADGMRALYDGYVGVALQRLEEGLEQTPGRKLLAQTTALVALLDGQAERAGFNARLGLLHHTADPILLYLCAISCFHLGQWVEARRTMLEARPELEFRGIFLLQTLDHFASGRLFRGIQSFVKLKKLLPDQRFVLRGQLLIQEWLFQTALLLVLALLILILPSQGILNSWLAALLSSLTMFVATSSLLLQARGALSEQGHPDLRLLSGDLLPRERRNEFLH